MLIGSGSKKPNLDAVRRIKRSLHVALDLPEDALVTVAQLACLEEDCAPLETVIGLLRPDAPQLQHKVHKPTDAVDAEDLMEVCEAWGFSVSISLFNPPSMRIK
jgi:hypothetical protein